MEVFAGILTSSAADGWNILSNELLVFGEKSTSHILEANDKLAPPYKVVDGATMANLVLMAIAEANYVSAMMQSLIHQQVHLKSFYSDMKAEWDILYAQEQQRPEYTRLIHANRSWAERENYAKLNHLREWQNILAAERCLDILKDLLQQLQEFLRFVYSYQRSMSDISRLLHTQSILST